MANLGSLVFQIEGDTKKLQSSVQEVKKTSEQMDRAFDSNAAHLDNVSKSANNLEMSMAGVASVAGKVFTGLTFGYIIKDLVDTSVKFENLNAVMKAVMGNTAARGSAELEWLMATTKKLGIELFSSAEAYKGLAAAAQGTSMQGQAVRDVFTAVAEASTVLGLSSEQTKGALLALQQMLSKGKVQAEELRGQLGERLPGAFQIAAKAMGVTTAELDKMLADGKVVADDFLPKFAKALHEQYSGSVGDAANRTTAAVNRLSNEFNLLKDNIAEGSGLSAAFGWLTGQLTGVLTLLNQAPERLRIFGSTFRETMNLVSATQEANMPLQNVYGQETYAGIGASEAPRPATYAPPEVDRETLEALMAKNDALAAAEIKMESFTKAQTEANRTIEKAYTPIQKLNSEMKKYKEQLAAGDISKSQFDKLSVIAQESYQKALEKGAKGAGPIDVVDIAKQLRQFEAEVRKAYGELSQESYDYWILQAENSGKYYDAEAMRISQWKDNQKRQIDELYLSTRGKLADLEAKMQSTRGVTPEALAAVEAEKKQQQELLDILTKRYDVMDKMEMEKYAQQQKIQLGYQATAAQLKLEYMTLTGSIKDQTQAQIELIQATLRKNEAEAKLPEIAEWYRKIAAEQERIARLRVEGGFGEGFAYEANKIGQNLPTSFDFGTQAAQRMKSAISDLSGTLAEFAVTGKMDMQSLANSVIKDLIRMQIEAWLTKSVFGSGGLLGWLGGFLGVPTAASAPTAASGASVVSAASQAALAGGSTRSAWTKPGAVGASYSISVPVTISGNAGAKTDPASVGKLSRELERGVKAIVDKHIQESQRPGNNLNRSGISG